MSNAVCTSCFSLTSLDKTSSQRCRCESQVPVDYGNLDCPSGFHLCYVCARTEVGGYSRWSWEACAFCKAVNSSIQKRFGFSLLLGRHSIMNGVSIPLAIKAAELDSAVLKMVAFAKSAESLSDWGKLRARELFESVPEWEQKKFIAVEDWQKKFKSDRKSSLEALRLYYGVKHLSDLLKKNESY